MIHVAQRIKAIIGCHTSLHLSLKVTFNFLEILRVQTYGLLKGFSDICRFFKSKKHQMLMLAFLSSFLATSKHNCEEVVVVLQEKEEMLEFHI